MGVALLRRHRQYGGTYSEPTPAPQTEAKVENVTAEQLATHLKNPAFAKAFNEELAVAAAQAKQSDRFAEAVKQELLAEEAKQSGALESELE